MIFSDLTKYFAIFDYFKHFSQCWLLPYVVFIFPEHSIKHLDNASVEQNDLLHSAQGNIPLALIKNVYALHTNLTFPEQSYILRKGPLFSSFILHNFLEEVLYKTACSFLYCDHSYWLCICSSFLGKIFYLIHLLLYLLSSVFISHFVTACIL